MRPDNVSELEEAVLVAIDWHKNAVKLLEEIATSDATEIIAMVDGKEEVLESDPNKVQQIKKGILLAANLIQDFPLSTSRQEGL